MGGFFCAWAPGDRVFTFLLASALVAERGRSEHRSMGTKKGDRSAVVGDMDELIARSNQLIGEMQKLIDRAREIRDREERKAKTLPAKRKK